MKKSVMSLRELILLGILIVLAAYYFVVQGPIAKETEALENARAQVDAELDTEQDRLLMKGAMERELEAVFAAAGGNPEALPDYNNINNVINELHAILDSSRSYNIVFGDDEEDDYVVRREIKINYRVKSYRSAIARLDAIRNSSNAYLLQDVAITEAAVRNPNSLDEETEYSVSLTMVSFDYKAA